MRDLFKYSFSTDISDQVPDSSLALSDDKKADVLIALMNSFRMNVLAWTERSYKATSWSVGIILTVVMYWMLHGSAMEYNSRFIVILAIFIFGASTQLYLFAARRAHIGNGYGIARCEAVLQLSLPDAYIKEKRFFGYSGTWLPSRSLAVLMYFHVTVVMLSIILLLFCHPFPKPLI